MKKQRFASIVKGKVKNVIEISKSGVVRFYGWTQRRVKTVTAIPLFIALIFIITWLYVSGEKVLDPTLFKKEFLEIHLWGLLLFMTLYRYWASMPERNSQRELRLAKIRTMLKVPLQQAIPASILGSIAGGLVGWVIFNQFYGVKELTIPFTDLFYLFVYQYVIVATIETIMFVKIMYDIAAGTEDPKIAKDEEFSKRGAVVSALSFATFHMGVVGVWSFNQLAWIMLWGFLFAYLGRKKTMWIGKKRRKIPFSGLALVIGMHAFLNILMVIYPLSILGGT